MWTRPIPSEECARACEWISLRLDSQLSDFESVLLEAHLASCSNCRSFAESVTGLTSALRATPLEEASFAFQLPRRRGVRVYGLRAVSAAAIAAAIGLSGLVGLQLSADRVPRSAARLDREVMALKEGQLEKLDNAGRSVARTIRPGLAAAEQVTIGSITLRQGPALHRPGRTEVRFPPNG